MRLTDITPQEIAKLKADNLKSLFYSNFGFLNEHHSYRPSRLHMLLGTAGSGKSTIVKDLIAEASNFTTALVYLSEEQAKAFALNISEKGVGEYHGKNIYVISELDFNENQQSIDYLERLIEQKIEDTRPQILFIDNITTSIFYAATGNENQLAFIKWLKTLADKYSIAIFMVAHTKKEVHDNMYRLITENDIRETANVINLIEYLYILQRFQLGKSYFPIIRTVKHRYHRINNFNYLLKYDKAINSYIGDQPIDFSEFKEIFKQRNKL